MQTLSDTFKPHIEQKLQRRFNNKFICRDIYSVFIKPVTSIFLSIEVDDNEFIHARVDHHNVQGDSKWAFCNAIGQKQQDSKMVWF